MNSAKNVGRGGDEVIVEEKLLLQPHFNGGASRRFSADEEGPGEELKQEQRDRENQGIRGDAHKSFLSTAMIRFPISAATASGEIVRRPALLEFTEQVAVVNRSRLQSDRVTCKLLMDCSSIERMRPMIRSRFAAGCVVLVCLALAVPAARAEFQVGTALRIITP